MDSQFRALTENYFVVVSSPADFHEQIDSILSWRILVLSYFSISEFDV